MINAAALLRSDGTETSDEEYDVHKGRKILHPDGSCALHFGSTGCPRSCWVVGQTLILTYKGKFSSARTYDTPEVATARLTYETEWLEKQRATYAEKNITFPPQYEDWEKVVWDGTNH